MHIGQALAWSRIYNHAANKKIYQMGVNPPADIASGRIAEVRGRSMSCNCMTRTSQQECRGILELHNRKENKKMEKRLFTSESVTEGHPDKMCDQISDAILDALMEQDPMSRVACETCTTTGLVMVMGEITTKGYVDIQKIVRDTVREIGYTRGKIWI